MFEKLERKFTLFNLAIISVMLLITFGAIYFINYKSIYDQNIKNIRMASNVLFKGPEDEGRFKNPESFIFAFNLIGNNNGLVTVDSSFEFEEDLYSELFNISMKTKEQSGNFKYDDRSWMFLISPISSIEVKVTILDITESRDSLNTLLTTLVILYFLMLIIIYFVSLYVSQKAIKPIKENYFRQKRFIEDASHELKTPLTVINANIDVLLTEKNIDPSKNKWVSYIKNEVIGMSALVNNLLILAKSEENTLTFKQVDISSVIIDIVGPFESMINDKKVTLNLEITEGLTTKIDDFKFKELMTILIDNAIKYVDNNGVINITLKKERAKIIFNISNSGNKIDESDITHIFDRFYRCDKSRTNNGSFGIGLSVAKNIVDKFGWNIEVSSSDQLTSFKIII